MGNSPSAPARHCTVDDIRYAAHVYAYFEEIDEDGQPVLDSLDVEDVKAAAGMDDEFWQCTNCDTEDWHDFEDAKAHLEPEAQTEIWG
jgi:hypothetical protein